MNSGNIQIGCIHDFRILGITVNQCLQHLMQLKLNPISQIEECKSPIDRLLSQKNEFVLAQLKEITRQLYLGYEKESVGVESVREFLWIRIQEQFHNLI